MPSVITTERAVLGRMEKHRWLLVRSASKPSLFIRFPATGIHPMAWLTKDIFTFRASLTACKIRKVQGVTVYWRNSSSTRQGHDHVRNANFQCLPSPVLVGLGKKNQGNTLSQLGLRQTSSLSSEEL